MAKFDMFQKQIDVQSFPAGEPIFCQGDPRTFMYVVNRGEVEIKVGNKTVEIVERGGIFGEMAMIDGSARTATAIARTDCKLVPIDEKRFQFLVQQTPHFAIEVMRVLAGRLRRVDQLIQSGI
jgi:CRP-like cAMP-binding protein